MFEKQKEFISSILKDQEKVIKKIEKKNSELDKECSKWGTTNLNKVKKLP